jgi:hypothetical protein
MQTVKVRARIYPRVFNALGERASTAWRLRLLRNRRDVSIIARLNISGFRFRHRDLFCADRSQLPIDFRVVAGATTGGGDAIVAEGMPATLA